MPDHTEEYYLARPTFSEKGQLHATTKVNTVNQRDIIVVLQGAYLGDTKDVSTVGVSQGVFGAVKIETGKTEWAIMSNLQALRFPLD